MFQNPETRPFSNRWTPADLPYVRLAEGYGLVLKASRDVTANVLPTVEYAHRVLGAYVFPLLRLFSRRSRSGKWLRRTPLAGMVESVDQIRAFYEFRTHPEYFCMRIRYAFLLFSRADE